MEANHRQEMPKRYTLSDYSQRIGATLSRTPELSGAWVSAEISDLALNGGHCYMTLIEKDSRGTTVARMRATIWAQRFAYIRHKFFAATQRDIANGMKVLLYGGINYHNSYGLSFNVADIDPAFTMGDLERLRREILEALRREGVIDRNKQLPISGPPQRIAIISSESAAGYGDFINQLDNNSTGAVFYHILFPAFMQGERTATSVIDALNLVEATMGIARWDCVAIIRGGGATTDMNGFDNLDLARRVATFPIPVAVGIGHERDRCVLDEIARIRCKTPTAVAAWLSDTAAYAWQKASDLATRAATFAAERLRGEQIRLQSIETMIPALADRQIKQARLKLHSISGRLPAAAHAATSQERIRLETLTATLRFASSARIDRERAALAALAVAVRTAANNVTERERATLENLSRMIGVLSPEATLRRGYTITRLNGKAVSDASQIRAGDVLETITAQGKITSEAILTEKTTQVSDNEETYHIRP